VNKDPDTGTNRANNSAMNDPYSKQSSHLDRKDHDDHLKSTNQLSLQIAQPMSFHSSLSVHFGNILEVDADCIVNAANEGLLGGGGIDHLIHQIAGPELAQFCFKLPIDSQGVRCTVGHSVITPGFASKYKFIIHTVGPYLDEEGQTQPKLLADCYSTAFKLAVDHGCRRVVFPAIATGFYGYPMLEAAQIAIGTLNSMLEQQDTSNSINVCVAVFNDLEQQIWRKLLNQ
jgi:O-acetyl-ADP-ribose deacetylase (regulator of RNase III)